MGDVLTSTFEQINSVCHKAVTKVGLDFPIWQYTTKIENAHWNRPPNSTLSFCCINSFKVHVIRCLFVTGGFEKATQRE
jgi:hypothetical protein